MVRSRTLAALALPAFALSACVTVPPAVRADGSSRLGETTRAGPLLVRADRLVEDSRCPINARCIWAGRVVLAASVTEAGRTTARNLVLGEPALFAQGSLVLDSVAPGTLAGQEIRPADYTFHFAYTPG